MAVAGIKYDSGKDTYALNCFPVRNLLKQSEDGSGAWKVAFREDALRRFNACLINKPSGHKHFLDDDLQEEYKEIQFEDPNEKILDGFYLLQNSCVEDPSDVCSVNISGQNIMYAADEDFEMFDNVAYINAGENLLPLEAYKRFSQLRELEVPFCDIDKVSLEHGDFSNLTMLDLSYNHITTKSVEQLGFLPNLRVLHLTGNELKKIPTNLGDIRHDQKRGAFILFPSLEVLMLDDNKLSDSNTFTELSTLRKLQFLNLEKNRLHTVPHLKLMESKIQVISRGTSAKSTALSDVVKNKENSTKVPVENQPEVIPAQPDTVDNQQLEETNALPKNDPFNIEFDSLDIEGHLKELELPGELPDTTEPDETPLMKLNEEIKDIPPPFSELRFVNLASNNFTREEALIAVAVWPSLSDIDIHNNPFLLRHIGDPPLLTQFLYTRLGINVYRRPPSKPTKQPLRITPTKTRQVSTYVPTVTKPSLEERMMLQFPSTQVNTGDQPRKESEPCSPMIASVSQSTEPTEPTNDEKSSASSATTHGTAADIHADTSVSSGGSDSKEINTQNNALDGDPFFVTQDENQEDAVSGRTTGIQKQHSRQQHEQQQQPSSPVRQDPTDTFQPYDTIQSGMSNVYDEYQDLLSFDETLDDGLEPLPTDLAGNVRALKYALAHERVYRDVNAKLDKVGKVHKPFKLKPAYKSQMHETSEKRVNSLLAELRVRPTYTDTPLRDVLHNKELNKESMAKAFKLIHTIEERYNRVRKDSKQLVKAEAILQQSLDEIAKVNKPS